MHCSVMGEEALEAAIRNWKGLPPKEQEEEGRLVCKCFGVTDTQIRKAIRENGLTTVEEVTNFTKAGGACGDCREQIQDILDELNSSEYKRALPSGIGGREQYSVEIYDKNGEVELSLGIADESMVNTGTFWEQRENGKLDLSLFQAITEEAPAE